MGKSKVLGGILKEVGKPVRISGTKCFKAREKFVVGNSELPIISLGTNFQDNFFLVEERNVRPIVVRRRKLLMPSVDDPILAALGDKNLKKIRRARVFLSHVFKFLKTADRRRWYVFYVVSNSGKVWAVVARWDSGDDGWYVGACSVEDADRWLADFQVVSR